MIRVLFVCTANICRSPMAEGVFRAMVRQGGYEPLVEIDSAGTRARGGSPPDARACAAAGRRGVDIAHLRSRRIDPLDSVYYDLIVVMDHGHVLDLRRQLPRRPAAPVRLLMSFAPTADRDEVPDPYFAGTEGFQRTMSLIEPAAQGLLAEVVRRLDVLGGRPC